MERLIRRESQTSDNSTHSIRMTVKADCIPEFKPGSPNLTATKWVNKIEQLGTINRWDEQMMIYQMQNKLSGLARTWFNNLNTYNYSWNEWKVLIQKTFPDHHDFATTLKKLVARVKEPHETITQYYFAKMDLLQTCKIVGKDAVSCVIDGLGDRTLQNSAKAGRYETPERLYEEFLSTLSEDTVHDKMNEERKPEILKRPFDKKRLGKREDLKRFSPYPKQKPKCFNCSTTGHLSTACPKPRVECVKCKFLGHTAENCKRTKTKTTEIKLIDLAILSSVL